MDNKQVSQLTTGLIVILVGLMLLGGQWRVGLDIGRLWPLFLIAAGVAQFMRMNDDGTRGNGTWLLFLGTLFLLNSYRIVRFSDSWPLFIVAAGVGIIFGRNERSARKSRKDRDVAAGQTGQPGNGSVQS